MINGNNGKLFDTILMNITLGFCIQNTIQNVQTKDNYIEVNGNVK